LKALCFPASNLWKKEDQGHRAERGCDGSAGGKTVSPDLQPAIEALHKAIQEQPANGLYHYAMAAILALDGDLEGSRFYMGSAESLGVRVDALKKWIQREHGQG
jgi:hypothetical protein